MDTAKRMRIAFVIASLSEGADEPSKAWMSWLAQQGHDVTAIPLSATAGPSAPAGVAVRTEAARAAGRSREAALSWLIAAERPDAVIGIRTGANLLCLAAARRLPRSRRPVVVVTEYAPLSLYLQDAPAVRRRQVRQARRSYGSADLAISTSHPVAAELTAAFGVPASRSLVVPRAVLAKDATRLPARGVERETDAAADDSAPIQLVLTCALTSDARPQLAVEAARSLADDGIRSEVVSLRGGPLEPELRRLAARRGIGFHTRHGSGAAAWELSPSAVVVLPSRSEGLGDELVEAAARGVPVAAVSSALGVADAIIPGITGELALDDDPASLADAVRRASRLKVADIEQWIDRFTPAVSGALLERALHYGHDLARV